MADSTGRAAVTSTELHAVLSQCVNTDESGKFRYSSVNAERASGLAGTASLNLVTSRATVATDAASWQSSAAFRPTI